MNTIIDSVAEHANANQETRFPDGSEIPPKEWSPKLKATSCSHEDET